MKRRALAYSGVVLGVVALASSFAEPVALAQGNSAPTANITVTCRGTGDIAVDYSYSGFTGAVHGVDFVVSNFGEMVDTVKGGSGDVNQSFNKSLLGTSVNWGAVHGQLLGHSGKVIAGSITVWNNGNSVTC